MLGLAKISSFSVVRGIDMMVLRSGFLAAAVILMANCGGSKCSQSTNEDNCLFEQSISAYEANGYSCVWLSGACKESNDGKETLRARLLTEKKAAREKAKADGQKAPENLKKACKDFVQGRFNYKVSYIVSKGYMVASSPTNQELEGEALLCAGGFYGECSVEDINKATDYLERGREFYGKAENKEKEFEEKAPQYSSEKCKL